MANVAKYNRAAIGHMFNHYERRSGDNVQRRNEKIDKTRTELNYDLHTGETADGERTAPTLYERLEKRLSEVKHVDLSTRADINLMCDWVVTLPQNVPPEKAREFFQHAYDFCCDRYGKENVLGAWVHMDETTPHMHFSFVPVVTDKDGSERLCAKQKVCRFDLQKFHPDLQNYVEEKMGQSVAVLNGATANGNRTIIEMKMQEELIELGKIEGRCFGLQTVEPIINDVSKMMNTIGKMYSELDTALKAKKWFQDNDKVKMQEVTKLLDSLRDSVNAAETIKEQAIANLNTLSSINIRQIYETEYGNLDELYAKAERRLKRLENSIKRRNKALQEREQNLQTIIDDAVQQKVEQEINRIDGEINQKRTQIHAMDDEISSKDKRLTELNVALWGEQDNFMQRIHQAQQDTYDLISDWSKQNVLAKNIEQNAKKCDFSQDL